MKDDEIAELAVGAGCLGAGAIGFILWLVGALFSLALTGVIIWGIYRLVIHFTGG